MNPFGLTRTSVHRDHAVIAPDSHVWAALPGWTNASAVVHVSPRLGARFTMYDARLDANAASAAPADGTQRFVYARDGEARLETRDGAVTLTAGRYAHVPAGVPHALRSTGGALLTIIEKPFVPLPGTSAPREIAAGHRDEPPSAALLGDEDVRVQMLLPDAAAYDMAVNVMSFTPGAALPLVECHVMEHGLLMLEGQGVYRLGERWHPVQAGDVIWMGPYCPQWFVAMGKTTARYLIYKDWNRDPTVVSAW